MFKAPKVKQIHVRKDCRFTILDHLTRVPRKVPKKQAVKDRLWFDFKGGLYKSIKINQF